MRDRGHRATGPTGGSAGAVPLRRSRLSGYRAGVLTSPDPTGLSSPLGQLVVLAGLVASLVVVARWWWQRRR
jgi:hypothetical protein